jgi:hypothetical protein
MNPNDNLLGGLGQKKKQFVSAVNQHYIAHNAVLPPYDLQNWLEKQKSSN